MVVGTLFRRVVFSPRHEGSFRGGMVYICETRTSMKARMVFDGKRYVVIICQCGDSLFAEQVCIAAVLDEFGR
jgi:hypothetical protein